MHHSARLPNIKPARPTFQLRQPIVTREHVILHIDEVPASSPTPAGPAADYERRLLEETWLHRPMRGQLQKREYWGVGGPSMPVGGKEGRHHQQGPAAIVLRYQSKRISLKATLSAIMGLEPKQAIRPKLGEWAPSSQKRVGRISHSLLVRCFHIKSNIGPSAGITGLLKAVLPIENGIIPGAPTFINPNPNNSSVFEGAYPSLTLLVTPRTPHGGLVSTLFGYGGSIAPAIVEQANTSDQKHYVSSYVRGDNGFILDDEDAVRPCVLVLSANDAASLRANITTLANQLMNPRVSVSHSDLAYTLSERRTRLWHRAFVTTRNTKLDEKHEAWTVAKKSPQAPSFDFVFTGQGGSMASDGPGPPELLTLE
ncbi:MAG: hypothetical protein Q9210_005647 [Variospora velana]